MDYIKKTISIEGARTRTQGLLPYFEFGKVYEQHSGDTCYTMSELGLETAIGKENGNWGQFVANPCFLVEKGKTYDTMLHNYYEMLNMVRNGVKLRRVETKEGQIIFIEDLEVCGTEPTGLTDFAAYDQNDFYAIENESVRKETRYVYHSNEQIQGDFIVLINDFEHFIKCAAYLDNVTLPAGLSVGGDVHTKWASYCDVVDVFIGHINIPANIYNEHIKVPKAMSCADVESYIEWLTNYPLSADCCNTRLWEDMGGNDMLEFLNNTGKTKCQQYSSIIEGLDRFGISYLEVPLLLTQNFTDVGVLTNVDGVGYEENDPNRPHNKSSETGFTIDSITMGQTRLQYPTTEEYEQNPSAWTNDSGYTRKPIVVESLLKTLRSPKKYVDDRDNVLPGLFQKYNNQAGEMFVCLKGDPKYYQLRTSSSTIGEETRYYVVYEENSSISDADIKGQGNFKTSYDPVFAGPFNTEQEAQAILNEEETKYNNDDTSNEYRICVVAAAWVMSAITSEPKDCINADGEPSSEVKYTLSQDQNYSTAERKYFRTITTPYAGIRIAMTEEEETGELDAAYTHYFFMVKYNNSSATPMTLPYEPGNVANLYCDESGKCRGDIILSVSTNGNTFEVTYAIGADLSVDSEGNCSYNGGGDIYYEKYAYDPAHVDYVALDGVDNVPVWSQYIDFEGSAKEFYSPRLNLFRTGNTANIIEMTTGDIWNGDYSYDAHLTKEEYLLNFSSPPMVDIDVTIDRGGASAFENHYKLAECNTIQDLEDYGNNFFNIQEQ